MNAVAQFESTAQLIEALADGAWEEHGEVFLLLDGARLPNMADWLIRLEERYQWVGLFGADRSALDVSPVLLRLPPRFSDKFLYRLLNEAAFARAFSVLLSRYSLNDLAAHFDKHLYVDDPDGARWGLAFWDPLILISLVGARPSSSTLVPGPVLTPAQCASLLAPIALWCIKGRDGMPLSIRPNTRVDETICPPFALTQAQMDQLTDIALPEEVGQVVTKAMPELVSVTPGVTLHRVCCEAVVHCRRQGNDHLAAFCAVALEALAQMADSANGITTESTT